MDENLDLDIVASSEQADAALSKLEGLLERIDKSLGNVTSSLDRFAGRIDGIASRMSSVSANADKARKAIEGVGRASKQAKVAAPDADTVINKNLANGLSADALKKEFDALHKQVDRLTVKETELARFGKDFSGIHAKLEDTRRSMAYVASLYGDAVRNAEKFAEAEKSVARASEEVKKATEDIHIIDNSAPGTPQTDAEFNEAMAGSRSKTWNPKKVAEENKEAEAAAEKAMKQSAAAAAKYQAQLERIDAVLDRLGNKVNLSGKTISQDDVDRVEMMARKLQQFGDSTADVRRISNQLQELTAASESNAKLGKLTSEMDKLSKSIEKAKARYETLVRAEQAAYANGRSVSGIHERMRQVSEQLRNMTRQYDILALRRREFEQSSAGNRMAATVIQAGANIKQIQDRLLGAARAATRLAGRITPIPAMFRRIEGAARKVWRLLQYRLLRTFIADMVKDLGTAMKYMAKADPAFNRVMTNISKGMYNVKGAIASAFTPLVNAIGPAVIAILNKIAATINTIGMGIAAMTGATEYKVLTASVQDYADGLDEVGKSAKKAEDTLAGFDTFNLLGQESKSGSGSDSGASYSAQPVDITKEPWYASLKNLGTEVARSFANVKRIIADALSPLLRDLGIDPSNIADGIANAFASLNRFLEANAPAISSIINSIIEILGRLGIAAFEAGWELVKWIFGVVPDATTEQALAIIADKLRAINDWLEENHDLVVGIIKTLAVVTAVVSVTTGIVKGVSAIGKTLHAVSGVLGTVGKTAWAILKPILSLISAHPIVAAIVALVGVVAVFGDKLQSVLQRVDDFLQGVFMADMRDIFGPGIGDVLNGCLATFKGLWDGIKQTLDGIIDLIRGVFSGDWKRAWTGVVEIFSGVFGTLSSLAKAPINAVISVINGALNLVNMVTDKINSISIDIPEFLGGGKLGFSIPRIPNIAYLSGGGMVNAGQLFVANERGPEMVGRIGNQSAVANQGQMTEALSSGVYNGFIRAIQSLGGSLGGGDINLNVELDGEPVYRNVVRRNRSQTRQTGRNPLMA